MSATTVVYSQEPDLDVAEFIDVLARSTLGDRRPLDDVPRMDQMLRQADLILTARVAGKLVGVARALTDFCFAIYLADLAVDVEFQGRQIGRTLLHRSHAAAGPQTQLILLAAPQARTYYPHIGLEQHDSCWTLARAE